MRNIAILCLLLACALPALAGTYRADEIPNVQRMDRRRYVSDPDGILSPAAVAHIDSVCASLRERGLAQVAVVAVDDIAGGDTFSTFFRSPSNCFAAGAWARLRATTDWASCW